MSETLKFENKIEHETPVWGIYRVNEFANGIKKIISNFDQEKNRYFYNKILGSEY